MASIITLSKTPEIIFLILNSLDRKDVLSLLQTCKALYPACYRQIWSDISFTDESQKLDIFANLVRSLGSDALGFCYTKTLAFGFPIFGLGWPWIDRDDQKISSDRADVIPVLQKLLDDNAFDLRNVSVDIYSIDTSNVLSDLQQGLLLSLKKYSESKLSTELEAQVLANAVHYLPKLFHLQTITELNLEIYPDHLTRESCWTIPLDVKSNILELVNVLANIPNLKVFSWSHEDPQPPNEPIEEISEELEKLQTVFTNMRKLRNLQLQSELFHSSFFLVPPDSVKTLYISRRRENIWWQKFSRCPMPSVEELYVYGTLPRDPNYQFEIGEVAIRGLKEFHLDRFQVPLDLRECIARGNRIYTPKHPEKAK
ncbi:hypothetical protein TWF281_010301 [Arthrobotrys megalospora]